MHKLNSTITEEGKCLMVNTEARLEPSRTSPTELFFTLKNTCIGVFLDKVTCLYTAKLPK